MLKKLFLLLACVALASALFDEECSDDPNTAYADVFILLENTQLVADDLQRMKSAIVEWIGWHVLSPAQPSSPIFSRFALMQFGETFSFESALGEWKSMADVNETLNNLQAGNSARADPAFALDGVLGPIRSLVKANSSRPITVILFSTGIEAHSTIAVQADKVKNIARLATMGVGNNTAALHNLDSLASSGLDFRYTGYQDAAVFLNASSLAACYCNPNTRYDVQYMVGYGVPTATCHTTTVPFLNFTAASANCASDGGWMVTETSNDKRKYMNKFALHHFGDQYFLGLHRVDENSPFLWNGTDKLVYRDWAAGFPHSGPGNDCVISNSRDWETTPCSTEQEFYCEQHACDASHYCDVAPYRYIDF